MDATQRSVPNRRTMRYVRAWMGSWIGLCVAASVVMPACADPIAESRIQTVGSGVLLGRTGPLVTNAHVVEACSILHVLLPNGTRLSGRVVRMDPTADLALIAVPIDGGIRVHLRPSPETGEQVWVSGFPDATPQLQTFTGTAGNVGTVGHTEVFAINGPIRPGDSGGGVFDASGNLVGMTFAGPNHSAGGYAMEAWRVAKFLRQAGITLPDGSGIDAQPEERIVARSSLITLRIECDQLGRPAAVATYNTARQP